MLIPSSNIPMIVIERSMETWYFDSCDSSRSLFAKARMVRMVREMSTVPYRRIPPPIIHHIPHQSRVVRLMTVSILSLFMRA